MVGKKLPWGEAVDLVDQLRLDMGSHLFMSIAGWSYPMSRDSLLNTLLTVRVINALKSDDAPAFTWDWPWPDVPDEDAVTEEERTHQKNVLKANSAFGQLRP